MNLAEKDRLHVRLLLLDPRSSEGYFRHNVERSILKAGLRFDVPSGCAEVSQAQQNIFKNNPQQFLQLRLYEHCPFAFMFATETEIFVEQYCYRDHTKRVALPLIKYLSDTPQYSELLYSFNIIWEHAGLGEMLPHHIGTAAAIEEARIKNIFRREQRGLLAKREIECLDSTRPGDVVNILAITGKFYVSFPAFETLRNIASRREGQESVKVRFALINPVSQQAILRAVADSSPAEQLRKTLCSWTWERHKNSRLYVDVHQTIHEIELWKNKRCSFELRLYSGSIACALLLTPNSAFIEQYLYGRSRQFQEGLVLGGEYPVFEYAMPESESEDRIEQEILSSTFNAIWNSYSISRDEYENCNKEEEFNKNLTRLLEELGCVTSDDKR